MTTASQGSTSNKTEKVEKTDAHQQATDVHYTEIPAAAPEGKVRSFLSGISKSLAVSLAGIAGIAVGAGAAVLVKNHLDKKDAEDHLAASPESHLPTIEM